jgi:hypothetical protein
MFHDLQHGLVLTPIKSLLKIQLQDYQLLPRFMTEVKIFKSPCQTILDYSGFNKIILVFVNEVHDYLLQSVGQELCQNLIEVFNKDMGL